MKYFYYDSVVFREPNPGNRLERFLSGEWKPATGTLAPSQEEYLRMSEITETEAKSRTGEASAS